MKPVGFEMEMKYKKSTEPLLLAVSANAVQDKPAMRMRFCWLKCSKEPCKSVAELTHLSRVILLWRMACRWVRNRTIGSVQIEI